MQQRRTAGNLLRKRREGNDTPTFIDQGYCFNAGEWRFPDSPLRGAYANNCVYGGVMGWEAFEPALSRAEEMDAGPSGSVRPGFPKSGTKEIETV